MNRRSTGRRTVYLLIALAIFVIDQASKAWAVEVLRFGEDRNVISGQLAFEYAENPGIAFGQLQQGGALGRWLLAALALTAAVAVFIYLFRTTRTDDRTLGACALLLAGITGNLVDRVRLGYVVDFILVHLGSYHWPTFNVADASICAGALLLAYDIFLEGRQGTRSQKSEVRSQ